jgi:prevent-host-death family protein
MWYHSSKESGRSVTASEARRSLFPLTKRVNDGHDAAEIVSRHGNAVLVSAEDCASWLGTDRKVLARPGSTGPSMTRVGIPSRESAGLGL